ENKPERLPALADELVRLKVDVIVAGGTNDGQAAKNATKTISIVMTGIGVDPVEVGLVESLARPGGNITGIAVLYDPAAPGGTRELKEDLPVAARAGLNCSVMGGTKCGQFDQGICCAK